MIVRKGLVRVEGIAYDYMGNNIFWADEGSGGIKVAKVNNASLMRTIVSENVWQLKSLAIDFKHRLE